MGKVTSCGVVLLNARRELFLCHATGTSRWDLPKGIQHPDESALQAALRELEEESSLMIEPEMLSPLGLYDYLPAKWLHLHAVRVAVDAFDIRVCRCRVSFPHRITGLPISEVDAYAWRPLNQVGTWCGKNMTRVLLALNWTDIERLPEVARVSVKTG